MNYRQNRDLYRSLNNEQTIKTNLNFGNSLENLKAEYLDMYEGVYVEVISTDKFDEDTGISTDTSFFLFIIQNSNAGQVSKCNQILKVSG